MVDADDGLTAFHCLGDGLGIRKIRHYNFLTLARSAQVAAAREPQYIAIDFQALAKGRAQSAGRPCQKQCMVYFDGHMQLILLVV